MRPSGGRIFRILTREALRDAVRRRIVPVIGVLALLSLLAVNSCTSCGTGSITANGRPVEVGEVAGWSGMLIYTALSLWMLVLAGLLASDHLAEPLGDGSANLTLARPVHRDQFALARLTGALVIAFGTGAIVLGATALLLRMRVGLPLAPAIGAGLGCAAGAVVVAALAMTVSLALTRVATALSVMMFVAVATFLDAFSLFGMQPGGVGALIAELAPPLCSAVVVALAPWIEPVELNTDLASVWLRLLVWAPLSLFALVASFRRYEAGR